MSLRTRISNAAEDLVGLVSPRRGTWIKHWRRMESDSDYRMAWMLAMRTMGYRAADANNGGGPSFRGFGRDPNEEVEQSLETLRDRARELDRDDPIGSGLVTTFINNVIGTGIRPQVRTENPEVNRRLESLWADRTDTLYPQDMLDHPSAQQMLLSCVLNDGDVFAHPVYERGRPVWIEIVEGHRVDTPMGARSNGGISQGVQRDAAGRVVNYWVMRGDRNFGLSSDFIPYPASLMRHLCRVRRPGQSRGVPHVHACLQEVRDLDLILLASIKRVQIAACLSVIIQSPFAVGDMMSVTAQKYGYEMDQSIEPGMFYRTFPGETVQTLTPNFPTPELAPFIITLARRIGAAVGISWQLVLRDFSGSTYSSARTDLLESRQTFLSWRRWFIEKYCNWEWRTVLEDARRQNDPLMDGISDDQINAVTWIGDGWKWVDPVKEARGAQVQLDMRITSPQAICASLGEDWEAIQDQLLDAEQRWIEGRAKRGMEPVPYYVSMNGQVPDQRRDEGGDDADNG